MDELLKAALTLAGGKTLEIGADFLKRVFGPQADQIGSERAERKLRRILTVAAKTDEMVMDLPLNMPPERLIEPILNGAGNEDDPYLQGKWAGLLANAVTLPGTFLPAYAEIMRQLVPVQAHILDLLDSKTPYPTMVNLELVEAIHARGIAPDSWGMGTASLLINDLHRLQVVGSTQPISYGDIGRGWTSPEIHENAYLTHLGQRFVAACRSPRRPPSP